MMPARAPLAAPELHQLAPKGATDEVQFVQARMYALLPALHFQMGWLASAHHCDPHKDAGLLAMHLEFSTSNNLLGYVLF